MPETFPLRRGLDEFYLCRKLEDCKDEGPGSPTPLRFYEKVSALVFIRSCIREPELERKLRLWLQSDPLSRTQPQAEGNLLEDVANRLITGNLTVAILKGEGEAEAKGILRSGPGQATSSSRQRQQKTERTPLADEMARREQAASEDVIVLGEPEPEPETTWIQIELVDASGKPAANERYKLTLPDGSVQWGRLDHNGKARVERLQPGNCQVTFPDRDEQVWDLE